MVPRATPGIGCWVHSSSISQSGCDRGRAPWHRAVALAWIRVRVRLCNIPIYGHMALSCYEGEGPLAQGCGTGLDGGHETIMRACMVDTKPSAGQG